MAVEKGDSHDPKRVQFETKTIETAAKPVSVVEKKQASDLYRAWVNPVGNNQNPVSQVRARPVIEPPVQLPASEQTFSQIREWKPGKRVQVYEKSKDFGKVLNPLSLRDFNRFIYRRNPSSP